MRKSPSLCGLLLILLAAVPLRAVPIVALVFSRDGTALVSNGDRQVDVRSPSDAVVRRHLDCELPKITSLAFAPNGKWLAVGGGEPGVRGQVLLFTWPDGKLIQRFGASEDVVTGVCFDASGTKLAAASADEIAEIWSLHPDGNPQGETVTFRGHAGAVLALAFSPSGKSIVTASADRSLKVWSATDGHLLRTFTQHTEAVHALAFRPAKTDTEGPPAICASGGDDRTVRVWQPEIGRMVRIVRQHDGPIFALAWRTDGSAIFSAGKEGIIRCIDAESDAVQWARKTHEDWIYALAVSPDGSALASGDWAGNVRIQSAQK